MNADLKDLKPYVQKALRWLKLHWMIVGILAVLFLYGWLVLQINLLSSREPSEDAVTEKLQTIKRPRIDQATIDRIQQLQDNSSEVKALFKQARDNPFQD